MIILGMFFSMVFLVLPIVKIGSAAGITLYVNGNAPPGGNGSFEYPYQYIQEALDDPRSADTISVASGSYNENIQLYRQVNLIGENKENTIIRGFADNEHTIKISKGSFETISYVNVSGFTILQNPTARNNEFAGIYIEYAEHCRISGCIIKESCDGIDAKRLSNSIINDNTIDENAGRGILLSTSSDGNSIRDNYIQKNVYGIEIGTSCNNNDISNNHLLAKQGSYPIGIGVNIRSDTSNNHIYHNYFDYFEQNAKDISTGNQWYKTSPPEGNFWDDYTGIDGNHDSIGDTPYIKNGVTDQYPLGYFHTETQEPTATILVINPTTASSGTPIFFSGRGDPEGSIVGYNWSSSINGRLSSSPSFSTSSLSVGTHIISFAVQDEKLDWSTPITQYVVITALTNQKPTASITSINPAETTYGTPIYFNGQGTDTDGHVVGYRWTSDKDGELSANPFFMKSNLSVGTHIISFRVQDTAGAWSNPVSRNVIISAGSSTNIPPIAYISSQSIGPVNTLLSFNGSGSYDIDGTIITYSWDFGDGQTGNGISVSHTYAREGNYTVILGVTDNNGSQTTDSFKVAITISGESPGHNGNGDEGSNWFGNIPLMAIALVLGVVIFMVVIVVFFLWMKRS